MLKVPKRVKHRRNSVEKCAVRLKSGKVSFSEYGLQATAATGLQTVNRGCSYCPATRYMKHVVVGFGSSHTKSYTAKAIGVRMGSGKGT